MSDHACPACGFIHPNMDDPDEQAPTRTGYITDRIQAAYEGYFPDQYT